MIIDNYINEYLMNRDTLRNQDFTNFEVTNLLGNPLLFLLVMGDCLEPYKNYCRKVCGHGIDDLDYSKDEVMSIFKNYNLTVKDNRIVITVPDGWVTACEEKLSDMKEWIAIKYLKKANTFYITPTTIVR